MSQIVPSSPSTSASAYTPSLTSFDGDFKKIEEWIESEQYEDAFSRFNRCTLTFNPRVTSEKDVKKACSLLCKLIPYLSSTSIKLILKETTVRLNQFPMLVREQMEVSFALGQALESINSNRSSAMSYYAKSITLAMACKSGRLLEIHECATHLIQSLMVDLGHYKKRSIRAVCSNSPEEFKQIFEELKNPKRCFLDGKGLNLLTQVFYQVDFALRYVKENRKKFDPSSPFFDKIPELVGKAINEAEKKDGQQIVPAEKGFPFWPITQRYREVLREYRLSFKEGYRLLCLKGYTPEYVRSFQRQFFRNFRELVVNNFLQEAYEIVGSPPAVADFQLVGSGGREEVCPFSDIEWFILVEEKKTGSPNISYWKTLYEILQLQVSSLDETAGSVRFSGSVEKKGLYLDRGDVDIGIVDDYAKKISVDSECAPGAFAYVILKSRSLFPDEHHPLFQSFCKEKRKLLLAELPEDEQTPFQKTIGQKRALKLLEARIKIWQEGDKKTELPAAIPIEQREVVNLKTHFMEPLYHFLNDLSIYFGIEETNTLDTIDQFGEKGVFSTESIKLLKEVVSDIYMIRVRLHLTYKTQENRALVTTSKTKRDKYLSELTPDELDKLKRAYSLVLSPLYTHFYKFFIGNDAPRKFEEQVVKFSDARSKLTELVKDPKKFEESLEEVRQLLNIIRSSLSMFVMRGFERLKDKDFNNQTVSKNIREIKKELNKLNRNPHLLDELKGKIETLKNKKTHPLTEIDLPLIAFKEIFSKIDVPSQNLIPYVVRLFLKERISPERHLKLYRKLSKQTITEPHREKYITTLEAHLDIPGVPELLQQLLSIHNRDRYRQAQRVEQRDFKKSIITKLLKPKNSSLQPEPPLKKGEKRVLVHIPGSDQSFYLQKDVVAQVLDRGGNLIRKYGKPEDGGSMHPVTEFSRADCSFHFKQYPMQPVLEHGAYSFMSRIFGNGAPPTLLVHFVVEWEEGKKRKLCYPVLISKTVKGRTLSEIEIDPSLKPDFLDHAPLDNAHFTGMLLSAILLKTGDGRSSNFLLDETMKIWCVDNDAIFTEPVLKVPSKRLIKFKSLLFLIKRTIPLDKDVLEDFISIDVGEMLTHWLDELEAVEKKYLALIDNEEERIQNYKKGCTIRVLLKAGALLTLQAQFIRLQGYLRERINRKRDTYPGHLLGQLITSDPLHIEQENPIGPYIKKEYELRLDNFPTPKQRLFDLFPRQESQFENMKKGVKRFLGRNQSDPSSSLVAPSVTSDENKRASLGHIPTASEVQSRKDLHLEEARTELLAGVFRLSNSGKIVTSKRGEIYEVDFSLLESDRESDPLARQRLIFRAMCSLAQEKKDKTCGLVIRHCDVLTKEGLAFFLNENLEFFTLSNCSNLPSDLIDELGKNCPALINLELTNCQFLSPKRFKSFQFSKLKELILFNTDIHECEVVTSNLNILKINNNSSLQMKSLNLPITTQVQTDYDLIPLILPMVKSLKFFSDFELAEFKFPLIVLALAKIYGHNTENRRWKGRIKPVWVHLMGLVYYTSIGVRASSKLSDEEFSFLLHLLSSQISFDASHFQRLDFEGMIRMNEEAASTFGALFPALRSLHTLNLTDCFETPKAALTVIRHFSQLPNIEQIKIGHRSLEEDIAVESIKVLSKHPTLKTLDLNGIESLNLDGHGLEDEAIIALSTRVFSNLDSLKNLSLRGNQIRKIGAQALAGVLPKLTSLESLDLRKNPLTKEDIKEIIPAILVHPTLNFFFIDLEEETLDFEDWNLGDDEIAKLSRLFSFQLSSQTTLNLKGNKITNISLILEIFAKLQTLKVVDFEGNPCAIKAGKELFELIQRFPALTAIRGIRSVDLRQLELTSETLHPFLVDLWRFPSLKSLILSENQIDDSGLLSIVKGLSPLKEIENLDLHGNQLTGELGEEGWNTFWIGCSEIPSLTSIDFTNNPLSKLLGASTLIKTFFRNYNPKAGRLASFSHLKVEAYALDLEDCPFDSQGMLFFGSGILPYLEYRTSLLKIGKSFSALRLIGRFKHLTSFILTKGQLNEDEAQVLANVLPELTLLETLDLSDNQIGRLTMDPNPLLKALSKIKNLKCLILLDNNLDRFSFESLAWPITHLLLYSQPISTPPNYFPSLELLDVSHNALGSRAPELIRALPSSCKKLYLRDVGIDDRTAMQCAPLLGSTFELIDLGRNKIGPQGAKALLSSLLQLDVRPIINLDSITALDLSDMHLNSSDIKYLSQSVFSFAPNLEKLSLARSTALDAQSIQAIFTPLSKMSKPKLRELNLEETGLDEECSDVLFSTLSSFQELECLILGKNTLNVRALPEAIHAFPILRYLDLRETVLNQNINLPLLRDSRGACLTSLNLSNSQLGKAAVAFLPQLLQRAPLTSLNLSSNHLDEDEIGSLVAPLYKGLKYLDLSHNRLKKRGMDHFAEKISEFGALRTLNIRDCQIDDRNLERLAARLIFLKNIRQINLGNNEITRNGLQPFAEVLPHLTTLASLSLANNFLGEKDSKASSPSTSTLKWNRRLSFTRSRSGSFEKVRSVPLEVLGRSLTQLPELSVLNLSECTLLDEGMRILSSHLQTMTSLTHLYLNQNQMKSEGIRESIKTFCSLPKVYKVTIDDCELLDLSGIKFNKESYLRLLYHALPQMPSLRKLILSNCALNQEMLLLVHNRITTENDTGVSKIPPIEELDLSNNLIGDKGFDNLMAFLSDFCLKTLKLENCGLTSGTLKTLLNYSPDTLKSVRVGDFTDFVIDGAQLLKNDYPREAFKRLSTLFAPNFSKMETLHLTTCRFFEVTTSVSDIYEYVEAPLRILKDFIQTLPHLKQVILEDQTIRSYLVGEILNTIPPSVKLELRHIPALRFADMRLTGTEIEFSTLVARLFPNLASTKELDFSGFRWDAASFNFFVQKLSSLPSLESLKVDHLDSSMIQKLIQKLPDSVKHLDVGEVKALDLEGVTLDSKKFEIIRQIIEQNKGHLKSLSIASCNISSEGFTKVELNWFFKTLADCSHLEVLNLVNIGIELFHTWYQKGCVLTPVLYNCLTLRGLNLNGNKMTAKQIKELFSLLPDQLALTSLNLGPLSTLDLSSIDLGKKIGLLSKIHGLARITTLNLSGCKISNLEPLLQVLSGIVALKTLKLRENPLGSKEVNHLLKALPTKLKQLDLGKIADLNLCFSELDEKTFIAVTNLFSQDSPTAISHLNLVGCDLKKAGTEALIKWCSSLPSLRDLRLGKSHFSSKLMKAISKLAGLRSLSFDFLSSQDGAVLAQSIMSFRFIKVLTIKTHEMDTHAIRKLVEWSLVPESPRTLEIDGTSCLDLSGMKLGPLQMTWLFQDIVKPLSPSLLSLDLTNCELDDFELNFLIRVISNMEKLEKLDLRGNTFSYKKLVELFYELAKLNLKSFKIDPIKKLDLSGKNFRRYNRLSSLIALLSPNLSELVELDLSACVIKGKERTQLGHLFASAPKLKTLLLYDPLGMEGIQALVEAVRANYKDLSIKLVGCTLSTEGYIFLKSQLPGHHISLENTQLE